METIIKWTGGKSTEFEEIREIIPNFNTYVEPFFGGGAILFSLEPKKAVINDLSTDLMNFYRFVKGEKDRTVFKKELEKYVDNWEKFSEFISIFYRSLLDLYKNLKYENINEKQFSEKVEFMLSEKANVLNNLFDDEFCINCHGLLDEVIKNVISKLKRIKKIELDEQRLFSDTAMKDHIETAFRSGFYMHFRNILNDIKFMKVQVSEAKQMANYYFIREFCYASMFRFNKKGEFNIPYGGIDYNKKNFRKKVATVFSSKVHNLLQNATIDNLDFEEFFKKHQFTSKDFIFFDPPYDTDFSEYDLNPFTKKDQERLSKLIFNLKANFILIIKNTPFILNLYSGHENIHITNFHKEYLYNVRGRNSRQTEHLIIRNF